MNRTAITVVVVALLCAAALAYSRGWFDWSESGREMESSRVGTQQMIEQDKSREVAMPVTQETPQPSNSAAQ